MFIKTGGLIMQNWEKKLDAVLDESATSVTTDISGRVSNWFFVNGRQVSEKVYDAFRTGTKDGMLGGMAVSALAIAAGIGIVGVAKVLRNIKEKYLTARDCEKFDEPNKSKCLLTKHETVLSQLNRNMPKCNSTADPTKCKDLIIKQMKVIKVKVDKLKARYENASASSVAGTK